MYKTSFSLFTLFLQLLAACRAASSLSSNDPDVSLKPNLTDGSLPPPLNASIARRYVIPDSTLVLYFWHQSPSIPREDVYMCLIQALSEKIFGNHPSDVIPPLNNFPYNREAFIHVQDLNPTVGRPHTYQDLSDTLRGIGSYMTAFNSFWTTEFQVWAMTQTAELKIGSGGVAGRLALEADAVSTGVVAQTNTPACNRGNQRCVA